MGGVPHAFAPKQSIFFVIASDIGAAQSMRLFDAYKTMKYVPRRYKEPGS
jgi:hypothetical protein